MQNKEKSNKFYEQITASYTGLWKTISVVILKTLNIFNFAVLARRRDMLWSSINLQRNQMSPIVFTVLGLLQKAKLAAGIFFVVTDYSTKSSKAYPIVIQRTSSKAQV